MTYTKTLFTTTVMATGLFLTACTSSSSVSYNDYIYNGINFGSDRDASFKKGVQDACKTADGDYTKNHDSLKTMKVIGSVGKMADYSVKVSNR